jgi:threonylcarbamoyladenosine tRNA methylthiotransferase MtaB
LNKIAIKTLGCKLNFSESAGIERLLLAKGYRIVSFEEAADIYIINTCAVTAEAEKKCLYYARSVKKKYPQSKIAFIGCFSSLRSQTLMDGKKADIVLGSNNKNLVVEKIDALFQATQPSVPLSEKEDKTSFFSAYSLHERTRSFLKIQDGCDYFCTYCTIPYARGNSRSDTVQNVIKNVKDIVAHNIKEIVLTGVNIGDFKTQKGENFFSLLQQIIAIEGLERLRISSIEPNLLTREILQLSAESEIILPHFHIPLQSGSNTTLKKMKRRYNKETFGEKIMEIKQLMPDACIAVDVIAGFPSESEEDFMESYLFIKNLPISYLHIFPYSRRAGTPAYHLPEQIPTSIKNQRTQQLIELSNEKKHQFYAENIGSVRSILLESATSDNRIVGFTDNYIKVAVEGSRELINSIQTVSLVDFIDKDTLKGKIIVK